MSLVENHAAGAGLAALELQKVLLKLLMLDGTIDKRLTIELIEGSLQGLEEMNASAVAAGTPHVGPQLQAARFHMTTLLRELRQIPGSRKPPAS